MKHMLILQYILFPLYIKLNLKKKHNIIISKTIDNIKWNKLNLSPANQNSVIVM